MTNQQTRENVLGRVMMVLLRLGILVVFVGVCTAASVSFLFIQGWPIHKLGGKDGESIDGSDTFVGRYSRNCYRFVCRSMVKLFDS